MTLQHFKSVIVPLDGSENALRALDYAAALAKANGMALHLLHVSPPTPTELMKAMGYSQRLRRLADASMGDFVELRQEAGQQVLAAARERLPADMAPVEAIRSGDPAHAILEYLESQDDAVIVMGRRGLSHFRELLMGSVSEKVLHLATCPVTILR